MNTRRPVITLDGPAASGKSTAARDLAAALRLPFISTGALYRAVAMAALRAGPRKLSDAALARLAGRLSVSFIPPRGGKGLRVVVGGRDVTGELQRPEVAKMASERVARVPRIRDAVNALARRLAKPRGAVAEGRDCGTVVFPHATAKFFVTATPEERARRRMRDFAALGLRPDLKALARDIQRRDWADANRPIGALKPAPDAWIVDTTGWTLPMTVQRLLILLGRPTRRG